MLFASLNVLIVLSCFAEAAGHAKLMSPEPRGGPIRGYGNKLRPFDDARKVANGMDGSDGCGGASNDDPGAGKPKVTYKPGQRVPLKWSVTIAHASDRKNTGVRIALKYSNGDSFEDNILGGAVNGDPEATAIDAGESDSESHFVTLPKGKTCERCTLQWLWAAENDGGFYLGCADIRISESGGGGGGAPTSRRRSSKRRRRTGSGKSRRRGASRRRRRRRRRTKAPTTPAPTTTTKAPTPVPTPPRRRYVAPTPRRRAPAGAQYRCRQCGYIGSEAQYNSLQSCPKCGQPVKGYWQKVR